MARKKREAATASSTPATGEVAPPSDAGDPTATPRGPAMYLARVDELEPSPTNPRRTFAGLEDMTASVREKGVLQPLLVRRTPAGRLEVVAGERRRRAAVAAGVELVPVIERDLTDDEVLEVQVIENNQREDVHPLEEARGFSALLGRGRDVAEIAARLGRSESYVRARLRLCSLVESGQAALERELLTLSGALIIAALDARQQEAVIEELTRNLGWESPMGSEDVFAASAAYVRDSVRRMHHALERAPWGLADGMLVPAAGACTTCPKRSGAQADLFGEAGDDVCLDGACWNVKLEALMDRHVAAGGRVLEGADAKEVVHYGTHLRWDAPVVGLDDAVPVDSEDLTPEELARDEAGAYNPPTWREVLGDVLTREPLTFVRTAEGAVIETFDREAAWRAVQERFPKTAAAELNVLDEVGGSRSTTQSSIESLKEKQRKREHQHKIAVEARRRCMGALVAAMEAGEGLTHDDLAILLVALTRSTWSEALAAVVRRRGWGEKSARHEASEIIIRESRELETPALGALIAEVILTEELVRNAGPHGDDPLKRGPLATLLESYAIDVKHHHGEARKALAPKSKAKGTKTKARAAQ